MSIIKRKAGCEDIVKSVLEFDEVPTEGSPNLVESGSVAGAILEGVKLAVFECRDNGTEQNFFTGPTYDELEAARTAGKTIVLLVHYGFDTVVDRYLEMTYYGFGRGYFDYRFTNPETGAVLQFKGLYSDTETHVWSRASGYGFTKSSAIAPEYDSTATYAVGDAVMHNGLRYECNTAISTAEAWNSEHWTETSVEDVIGDVETLLAAL